MDDAGGGKDGEKFLRGGRNVDQMPRINLFHYQFSLLGKKLFMKTGMSLECFHGHIFKDQSNQKYLSNISNNL